MIKLTQVFDTDKLLKGTPVMVHTPNEAIDNSYEWAGIVVQSTPLMITVVRYNPKVPDDVDELDIEIESVTRKHNPIRLTPLVKDLQPGDKII